MSNLGNNLTGYVCLVTGASRGIGRGVAVALGECGATVYITARTLKPKTADGDSKTGSLEETAAEISSRGGVAIPISVDHSDDTQVHDLFARIRREQKGRLDVLVNNVYAGVDALSNPSTFKKKFWELSGDDTPGSAWDIINNVGLRNHYICSVLAIRMMLEYRDELSEGCANDQLKEKPRPGLIFNISSIGGLRYLFTPAYGIGKSALDRMSADMSAELNSVGRSVSVMSIWPGLVRTENMLDLEAKLGDRLPFDLATQSESPEFTGRVVAAIAGECRDSLLSRSGRVFVVADVASSLGICDIDGRSPLSFRSLKFLLNHAGWKRLAAYIPGFLKVPYFLLSPASPRF